MCYTFFTLFAFYSRFLSFVQNNLNTISTHVHINKQQGSIHLHQSLNWHILRSCFFVCTKFLLKVSNSMCFISKNVLILVPFLFYIFFTSFFPFLFLCCFFFFRWWTYFPVLHLKKWALFTCSIHLLTYTMKELLTELEYCFQFTQNLKRL